MVYTISIGSNEGRRHNMQLARKRLSGRFPGICFSTEEDTPPLFFKRPAKFSNQVARFESGCPVEEVIFSLKTIEHEAGRRPGDKILEIVRLDIDVLMCDEMVYKPEDLCRDYIVRGLQEIESYVAK